MQSRLIIIILGVEIHDEVPGHLETQPRAGHRRRDLEQVRTDAFVQALETFLGDDDADGVEDALVLVAHARHGVDLEAAAEDVARFAGQSIMQHH